MYDFTSASDTLVNNSTASSQSAAFGEMKISVIYSAQGGSEPYQYCYSYKMISDTEWSDEPKYSTEAENTFAVYSSGTYLINLKVKDTLGTVKEKIVTVEVDSNGGAAL